MKERSIAKYSIANQGFKGTYLLVQGLLLRLSHGQSWQRSRQEYFVRTFPSKNKVGKMMAAGDVDYLIGLKKALWHPVRCERAKFGADLWVIYV